jgi:outer membrane protein assembly factor BamE
MTNLLRALRAPCLAVLLAAVLASCARIPVPVPSALEVYRIDVQQGNVTTQDMVSSLKPGMSKDQIKFILGTPLLSDMFHANRWDYVYRLEPGRGPVTERRFTLFFEKDLLVRIEGDVIPIAQVPGPPPAVVPPAAAKTKEPVKEQTADATAKPAEEKSFWARLREKIGL